MNVLLSFAAALVSLRLAGSLLRSRRPAWAGALLAYAAAAAAMAWGSAHGWDTPSFRVYYLAGGLLTAPLLGVGSLLLARRAWAAPLGFAWVGLSIGLVLAMPVHGSFGTAIPAAQDHVDWLPRVFAIAGNSLGTVAVVLIALTTFRRRPFGNSFILGGVAVAAAGSTLSGLGVSAASGFALLAVILLYVGVAEPSLTLITRRASRAVAR
ncbi:MAG TPA: hypothetical protein VG652_07830 [Gaiellaceae bacterium]|nr:hypothetical protein [Gaiellaceae bacterium]